MAKILLIDLYKSSTILISWLHYHIRCSQCILEAHNAQVGVRQVMTIPHIDKSLGNGMVYSEFYHV